MALLRRMLFRDVLEVQRINIANATETFLLSTFLNTLATSYSTSFVAEADGCIVGYIEAAVDVGERLGRIHSLCVDGPFRRCGLGRGLVELALDAMRIELGDRFEAELHVRASNSDAVALYTSLGFSIVGHSIPYYEQDAPAHKMRLRGSSQETD